MLFAVQMAAVMALAEVGEEDGPRRWQRRRRARRRRRPPTRSRPDTDTTETETETTETETTEAAGDPVAGKEIFTSVAQPSCTTCHTLADAGATGMVGPNLERGAAARTTSSSTASRTGRVSCPRSRDRSARNRSRTWPHTSRRPRADRDRGSGTPIRCVPPGEVSEWPKERDWKSRICRKVDRGFKSRPLRLPGRRRRGARPPRRAESPMSERTFDVIVIGAGPAGEVCAGPARRGRARGRGRRALPRRRRVLVLRLHALEVAAPARRVRVGAHGLRCPRETRFTGSPPACRCSSASAWRPRAHTHGVW